MSYRDYSSDDRSYDRGGRTYSDEDQDRAGSYSRDPSPRGRSPSPSPRSGGDRGRGGRSRSPSPRGRGRYGDDDRLERGGGGRASRDGSLPDKEPSHFGSSVQFSLPESGTRIQIRQAGDTDNAPRDTMAMRGRRKSIIQSLSSDVGQGPPQPSEADAGRGTTLIRAVKIRYMLIIVFVAQVIFTTAVVGFSGWYFASVGLDEATETLRNTYAATFDQRVTYFIQEPVIALNSFIADAKLQSLLSSADANTRIRTAYKKTELQAQATGNTVVSMFLAGQDRLYVDATLNTGTYTIGYRASGLSSGLDVNNAVASCLPTRRFVVMQTNTTNTTTTTPTTTTPTTTTTSSSPSSSCVGTSVSSGTTFDPTAESWYTGVVTRTSGGRWSGTESFFRTPGRLTVTLSKTVRDTSNSIIGVAGTTLDMQQFGSFLTQVKVEVLGGNGIGTIFLVERSSGRLVASTEASQALVDSTGAPVLAQQAADGLISQTSQFLLKVYNTWDTDQLRDRDLRTENRGLLEFVMVREITEGNGLSWWAVLVLPEASIDSGVRANTVATLISGFLGAVVSLCFAYLVTTWITRPLRRVTKQLDSISRLEFPKATDADHFDVNDALRTSKLQEITMLASSLDHMTNALKSFSKYVPIDVVRMLLALNRPAELECEQHDVSILFSDIADFTSISESLSPEDLLALMSEYLQEMSKVLLDRKGVVDKYIGDAIMGFWNAPRLVVNHEIIACEAALASQRKLKTLQDAWKKRGFPHVHARIGLNCGNVLVGNMGSQDRLSYTMIGDNVNLAARLEGLNKYYGTAIMISGNMHEAVKHKFLCRPLDLVTVKGKTKPTKVYELIGERHACSDKEKDMARRAGDILSLFVDARFDDCLADAKDFLRDFPDDLAMQRRVTACKHYLDNPRLVGRDWNGVSEMTEK